MAAYAKILGALVLTLSLLPSFQAYAGKTKLQGSLIINPGCAADVNCPIDAIEKGKYKIQSSDKAGENGIRFQFLLKGVTKDGVEVNLNGVFIRVPLEVGDAGCTLYVASPSSDIASGRLKGNTKFTGSDTSPPIPTEASGTEVRLCAPVSVSFAGIVLVVDGLTLGGP